MTLLAYTPTPEPETIPSLPVFHLYRADTRGNEKTTVYPHPCTITTVTDLEQVTGFDHVAARYRQSRRTKTGFLTSDCLIMDVDNDHSENPNEWVYPDQVATILDCACYTATSRSHLKAKGALSARPRFHVYIPIPPVESADEYADMKASLARRFTFFDPHAVDSARFLYGVDGSEVHAWPGRPYRRDVFADFALSLPPATAEVIMEGSRNATLSHFAGRVLKRYGDGERARALFDERAASCLPPLEESELEAIWASARRFYKTLSTSPDYVNPDDYARLEGLKPGDYSDIGQAGILVGLYRDRLRYTNATGWLVYHDGAWEESVIKARGLAQQLTDLQLNDALMMREQADDACERQGVAHVKTTSSQAKLDALTEAQTQAIWQWREARDYIKFIASRRSSASITSTLEAAKPYLEERFEDFDADPYMLNTPDGTFDLRTGARHPHNPDDLLMKQTSLAPSSEGAGLWEETLERIFLADTDMISFAQRLAGLILIGTVKLEALIIAVGDGANGKSTFWNVISRVIGTYAGNLSADVLTMNAHRNTKPELAEAKGKRLLIAAELEEGQRLSTSIVKQLCSTDDIYAEKKFRDPFSFTPSHTTVLYTNHLPRVGATDTGIWRRLLVLPFRAKITGDTDIKNFADYLYTHAGGAILTWMMEGARIIHQEDYRLCEPESVSEAGASYRSENDWMSQFLEERCVEEEGASQAAGELYEEYRVWVEARGDYRRRVNDFSAELEKRGFTKKKTMRGMVFYGISLKPEVTSSFTAFHG